MKMQFAKMLAPLQRLFWRAQISVLHACPPLSDIASGASLGAEISPKAWVKAIIKVVLYTPRALLFHYKNKRKDRLVLARVAVYVTTRCTLNCDKCIAHIPDMKRHRNVPWDELFHDIQALFSCVDHIYTVDITGGEALLHPDLDAVLRLCADAGKVSSIVVATNGTIIPEAKVLAALRETGARVRISRYPAVLQPGVEALKSILKDNKIQYTHASGTYWRDSGAFGQLQQGSEMHRFSLCILSLYTSLVGGKLHLCGKAGLMVEEGIVAHCEEDYIDLRAVSPEVFRGQWRVLEKKRAVAACSHCLGYTHENPKIPVAEQRQP